MFLILAKYQMLQSEVAKEDNCDDLIDACLEGKI